MRKILTVDEVLESGEDAAKKLGFKNLEEYMKVNGMADGEEKENC